MLNTFRIRTRFRSSSSITTSGPNPTELIILQIVKKGLAVSWRRRLLLLLLLLLPQQQI
jgi:hypothetical protein